MSTEAIVALMLGAPSIATHVGTNVWHGLLPQGAQPPAISFHVVSAFPDPEIAYQRKRQRMRALVQIRAIAKDAATVASIGAAVRDAIDWTHHVTVGANLVISCRLEREYEIADDEETRLRFRDADYALIYE